MLVVGFVNEKKGSGRITHALRPWFFSWGLAVILVGVITLVSNLKTTGVSQGIYAWYGVALLIAACGGLVSVGLEIRKQGKPTLIGLAHLITSLVIAIPGLLAILN